MRFLAAIGLLAVVLWLPMAGPAEDGGTVRVTDVLLSERPVKGGTLQVFAIQNRSVTPNDIGNAALICMSIDGPRGPLPPGSRFCWGSYSIGFSSIQVQGIVRSQTYFQLAITGGLGAYSGHGGTLTVIRYAREPVRERLVFRLIKAG